VTTGRPNLLIASGVRVKTRGNEWTVSLVTSHADCQAVRLAGSGRANPGVVRTLLTPFDRLVPVSPDTRIRVVRTRRWLRHVSRVLRATHPFGGLSAAARADIHLLPFQLEPGIAMLRHGRSQVLIADEVGLGKTIQAGVILAQLASDLDGFRAIVLTPAGLREQWQTELQDRFALPATIADASWLAGRARDLPSDVNPWSLPGLHIASLDLVKRPEVLNALEDVTWDIVVVDEAHGAGLRTARLAAAHAVARTARRVVLLTATPPDGEPAHFAALATLGRLHTEPVLTEFRRTRADAGAVARRKSILLPVRLSPLERRMHRLLDRYTARVWTEAGDRQDVRACLAAVILRKRALSSAASLALSARRRLALLGSTPSPFEQQLRLPLPDEDPLDDRLPDEVIGASGLSDVALERALLEEIAAVAEDASRAESKLALLRRMISRTAEPMIVFTEYRDTLARIAAAVSPVRTPVLLHGDMTPRDRSDVQRAFNHSGSLLLATDAASEGLNLHERCRLVVHFELPWTPARLEQRTGRVDRLGQTRVVHEVLLVARDTCERMVLAPLVRRARTAAARARRPLRISALTESRVAAAVMEGAALDDVDVPPPVAVEGAHLDLAREAADEAARLVSVRRLSFPDGTKPRGVGSGDIVVTADAGGGPALLIVELRLERDDGRCVHSELVPISLDIAAVHRPRTASRVAALAAGFIPSCEARVFPAVDSHCRDRLAVLTSAYQNAAAAAARREREIACAAPSVAQQLVQVGLFDARGTNALEARRRAASLVRQAADDRLADLAPGGQFRIRLRTVALRFGRGRR
jgi:superfamily II DNA or RNA helicase